MADFTLSPSSGVYTIVGAASILAFTLGVASGAYALTGTNANTVYGHPITANAGVYTVTGVPVQISKLSLEPAGYQIEGFAANLLANTRKVVAVSGAYTVTAPTSYLVHAVRYPIAEYLVAGTAATLTATGDPFIGASPGAYAITGTSAALISTLTIDSGDYGLTGTAANVFKGKGLVASSRAFAINSTLVTLKRAAIFPAGTGSYTYTGFEQNIFRSDFNAKLILANIGAYTLASEVGEAVHLNVTLNATSGVYTVSGTQVSIPFFISPGQYSITGRKALSRINANSKVYSITGAPAFLVVPVATLTLDSGVYTTFGFTASPRTNYLLALESPVEVIGSYALQGSVATLRATRIHVNPGAYQLTGVAVTLQSTRTGRWRKQPPRPPRSTAQPLHASTWIDQLPGPGVSITESAITHPATYGGPYGYGDGVYN
jgi:hypothetical protein